MSQITILNVANQPQGPFTREQVAEKLQKGEFTLSSLAYVDGLSQWTPLRDVLSRVDAAAAPADIRTPPPVVAAPAYSYAATMQPPEHLVYAGFWLRFAAIFIDGLILAPLSIISLVLQFTMKSSDNNSAKLGMALGLLIFSIFAFVIRWLYFAFLESSGWQATVGKKAMGLKVTGLDGQRISFGRASGRCFGKLVSVLTLCVGYIMAGFTERKQALHDMLAGTLVIRD